MEKNSPTQVQISSVMKLSILKVDVSAYPPLSAIVLHCFKRGNASGVRNIRMTYISSLPSRDPMQIAGRRPNVFLGAVFK